MIRLEHIHKQFGAGTVNEVTLFQDFNFEVLKGQFVSVVGSNGSGKTTMLNVICGSLPVDSGKVLFNGEDISKLKEHVRAKKIGRVFQDPAKGTCANMTIRENMALAENKNQFYGLGFGVKKARENAYKEQLWQLRLGLEDKLDIKVGSLSGGQRQALALLLATMTPVDLLILDEHTAALDPNSSETVMRLTGKIVAEKGLTALMVTHNLRYAVEYGNRLVMMHQGKVIKDLAGEEKANAQVKDLLTTFNEISIECGN